MMSEGKTSSTKRCRLGVLRAAMTACVFASAGAAIAADSSCADFGTPIDAGRRDTDRGQGFDAPRETKLGVILWDEYRGRPGDSGGIIGNARRSSMPA
jgi:hypothetical protein